MPFHDHQDSEALHETTFILRPIHKLENDFPFLYKTIEFRLLLLGLEKTERIRYSERWFAREKESFLPPSIKLENANLLNCLQENFIIRTLEKEQLEEIYNTSLHENLKHLTKSKLSGSVLKIKEEAILSELKAWVNETDDKIFTSFLLSTLKKLIRKKKNTGITTKLILYYSLKTRHLYPLLDNTENYHLNQNKSELAWMKQSALARLHFEESKGLEYIMLKLRTALFEVSLISFALQGSDSKDFKIFMSILGFFLFLALCKRAYYVAQSFQERTQPLEFSEDFGSLIESFLQDIINNLFIKKNDPHYTPRPADLPTLVAMLSPYACHEADEQQSRKEKSKTRKLLVEGESLPVEVSPKEDKEQGILDIATDLATQTHYIPLTNGQSFKYNKTHLSLLFQRHYPKESPEHFLSTVWDTVTTDRKVDSLNKNETQGKKSKFPECTHKLRTKVDLFRLGLRVRPPTPEEKNLLQREQGVHSPKILSVKHRKGRAL